MMHAPFSLHARAVIPETRSIQNAMVLIIGADGRVLHFVAWQRALMLINAGHAYVIETVKRRDGDGNITTALVRSPSVSVELPLIIGLVPHVDIPAVAFIGATTLRASREAVLRRDHWTCTYCGGLARTIDHIIPRSRGGQDTWQNLVAACSKCNSFKNDRTPEEAGMPMQFDPRVDEGGAPDIQSEVWHYINKACGIS